MNIDLMDYFAAKAMQSLLLDDIIKEVADENEVFVTRIVASMAYEMAQHMMEEREDLMKGHDDPIQ